MEFKEFTEVIRDNIKNYLPSRYQEAEVSLRNVIKNNGLELTGLQIKCPGENVTPCIYLNSQYMDYKRYEMSINDVCKRVAAARLDNELQINPDRIISPEYVKENVFFRVVGIEDNKDMLSQVPHTIKNDLVMTYHVATSIEEGACGSYRVENAMLERIGIDKDTLHEFAMKNTPELFPPRFESMSNILIELGMPEEMARDIPGMYVLSNESSVNGASAMLYPGVLDDISNQIGKDLVILPSSVHETIIMPKEEYMNVEDLKNMVNEVNTQEVALDEILSNNVYEYDSRAKALVPMNDPLYKANVNDLRQNGFQPTKNFVKNMESLNKATGRNNTLKDVKEICTSNEVSAQAKEIAADIAQECKAQEMMQTLEP